MYQIEVTGRALADADAAYAWMADHISQAFAEKWYQGLFKQIETPARYPTRCPVAAESYRLPEQVRELTYGKGRQKHKHRILFAIRENVVTILYVYHTSRQELEP